MNKLTVFFAICLVAVVSADSTQEKRQKFLFVERQALKKCQESGGFPISYIDDVFRKRTVPADSKCFVHCAFTGIKWVNDAGDPDVKNIQDGVRMLYTEPSHEKQMEQFVQECNDSSPKDDQCEWARTLLQCVFDKDKAVYTPTPEEEAAFDKVASRK